ncbi:MAG: helix-hairpin-helix domain-containing protein [Acidobacteria bacterium]|nr:MAG: helix-hairpin-helix domain-containing protein [Acidobacteriota bacterium]
MQTYRTVRTVLTAIFFLALAAGAPLVAADVPEGQVNVNTADAEQLALLPRIGPALAARIIEFREENGPFEQAEDLILVRGIGEKTFALMERFVVVEGDTTLSEKVRPSMLESSTGDENDR